MLLTYNGLALGDVGASRFQWGRKLVRNRAGIGQGFLYRVHCSQVSFACAGQTDCAIRMANVEAALAAEGGDLLFLNDDGSRSQNSVLSAATLSGVRCVEGPTWGDRPGAQFSTWREYACVFEWETSFGDFAPLLTDFSETLTVRGGQPRLVVLETLNTPPVLQTTVPLTGYRAVQEGFAVGYQGYPDPSQIAPPVWPLAQTDQQVTTASPERVGPAFRNYTVRWQYTFASADPLFGLPNAWTD